jgi:hypothetical protein
MESSRFRQRWKRLALLAQLCTQFEMTPGVPEYRMVQGSSGPRENSSASPADQAALAPAIVKQAD